jgi:hypothetical protein
VTLYEWLDQHVAHEGMRAQPGDQPDTVRITCTCGETFLVSKANYPEP